MLWLFLRQGKLKTRIWVPDCTFPCFSKLPKSCDTHTHTYTHTSDCIVSTLECISFKCFLYRSDTFNLNVTFMESLIVSISVTYSVPVECANSRLTLQQKCWSFCSWIYKAVYGLGWHQDWQWRHSHCESIVAGKLK